MVVGYVRKARTSGEGPPGDLAIPPDLRRRLTAWVDVEEVGAEGFWLWLRAILPLLPTPALGEKPQVSLSGPRTDEVRELQQRLVVYAREHARLNVLCDQYTRDNDILSRRLKALEAVLRTFEMAGARVEIPEDEDVGEVTNRYLRLGKGR